jgi:hypothetical protein
MGSRLFAQNISDLYEAHCTTYKREIDQIQEEDFIRVDPEQLASELATKYHFDCPILGSEDQYSMDAPNFLEGSRSTTVLLL